MRNLETDRDYAMIFAVDDQQFARGAVDGEAVEAKTQRADARGWIQQARENLCVVWK
jgi:hypothetical protein